MTLIFRHYSLKSITCKYILPRDKEFLRFKFSCSKLYQNIRCNSQLHYEEAISTLNSLQSNVATLEAIKKNRSKTTSNVATTQKFLERIEMGQDDLKKLNIIHISGTKGKGSTCAFVESILQEHGYKVGFYSSPHLVMARERIRISKRIITEKMFMESFWDVFNLLKLKQSYDGDMPSYFKFLTLLAFRIFLKENVDVAVVEVGIGGEYDCTNVIRYPTVCGITSLDLDHTSILGNTIEDIAWQKAGIMKNAVPTFTVDHSPSSLKVIQNRAIEKGCELLLVPQLMKYCSKENSSIRLGLDGSVQLINASLALQLSHYWINVNCGNKEIRRNDEGRAEPFKLAKADLYALKNISWPGRSQIVRRGAYTYFIDGAHTSSSMSACVDWFQKSSLSQVNKSTPFKIFIFNITGDRDPLSLLQPLLFLNFDLAIFTTNMVSGSMDASSDQKSVGVSETQQIEKCRKMKIIWNSMNNKLFPLENETKSIQRTPSVVFPYIQNAIDWIYDKDNLEHYNFLEDSSIQILVTGSMHLVGGVLAVIDPEMTCLENLGPIMKHNNRFV